MCDADECDSLDETFCIFRVRRDALHETKTKLVLSHVYTVSELLLFRAAMIFQTRPEYAYHILQPLEDGAIFIHDSFILNGRRCIADRACPVLFAEASDVALRTIYQFR